MGQLAEIGPFATSSEPSGGEIPSTGFAARHADFVRQMKAFTRCFQRHEISGFTPEELDEHLSVSLLDNKIVQDGDRFCTDQVAYEMKDATKGYTYPSRR